jgi:hypothetical protein
MSGGRRFKTMSTEYTADSIKVPSYYNRVGPGGYENDLSQTGQKTSISSFKNVPSYTIAKVNLKNSGARNCTINYQDFLKQNISNTRFS